VQLFRSGREEGWRQIQVQIQIQILSKGRWLAAARGRGGRIAAEVANVPALPADAETRWADAIAAFDAEDGVEPPPAGSVVFVGSSSIRLWEHLQRDFDGVPVVQRGFGGSRLADCVAYLAPLVLRYRPRQVVVYAGDNDLAEGHTPAEVLASFDALVAGIRASLPRTRITYVSIKPSPSRAALLPQIAEANRLIANRAATLGDVEFVDVYSAMLDNDGRPRSELFAPDRLHMNAAGYRLWRQAIGERLHE
jgi:lysophospholipase L1-like esterase